MLLQQSAFTDSVIAFQIFVAQPKRIFTYTIIRLSWFANAVSISGTAAPGEATISEKAFNRCDANNAFAATDTIYHTEVQA